MHHPTVTRKLEFDAGHRVLGHQGKCRHIHGHRYIAEVSVRARELNDLGMVVDFSKVKELVGGWIDNHWDHNIILHPNDPLAILFTNMGDRKLGLADEDTGQVMGWVQPLFNGKDPYVMDLPPDMPGKFANPTAENMARVLFNVADLLLHKEGVEVVHVRLYETPNCWADYPCSH